MAITTERWIPVVALAAGLFLGWTLRDIEAFDHDARRHLDDLDGGWGIPE